MACGTITFNNTSSFNTLKISGLSLGSANLYYVSVHGNGIEKYKWTELAGEKIVDISQYSNIQVSIWIKSAISSGYSSGNVRVSLSYE